MNINKCLKMGNLNDALSLLVEQTAQIDRLHSDAILLQASWKFTETDYKRGLLSRKEYDVAFNRTVEGVQHVMSSEPAIFASDSSTAALDNARHVKGEQIKRFKKLGWIVFVSSVLIFSGVFAKQFITSGALDTNSDHPVVPLVTSTEPNFSGTVKENHSTDIKTHTEKSIPQVIVYDENGKTNNEYARILTDFLEQAGFEVQHQNNTIIPGSRQRFEARLDKQTEELVFFNKKVARHSITLTISLLKEHNEVTRPIVVRTIVESDIQDKEPKIMTQALSDMLIKIKNQNLLKNFR